ncbi:uncharacterized protein LOC136086433 [Hydra vulgaris]|uniref:Uncharacterized protein LOC136086433 n=1 Tax=Hydra vulgaris TaxID=6087 RepID=A0ABM4CSC8_HYDVU
MRNFGVLIDNLKDCNDIYKKYCKEELVNEKFAAIAVVNATSSVVEMSKNILKMGNAFIKKLDTKAQNIIINKSDLSALIRHDPGLRPHTITDNQKLYLIQLGPHQPKLASFPSNGHIDHLIDKSNRLALIEEQKIEVQNRKTVEILIDTCKTLGSKGLTFRELDSANQGYFVAVVNLIYHHNPALKSWIEDRALRPYRITYTSPFSQNEMISLIATELKSKIIDEINSSNFFSVMVDSTPDMSHTDIISIVVRTASENGDIRKRLLKSVEYTDKTGKGMAELILSSLHKEGIDTSKMAFQSYDFANSMSGQFKGVQKYITEEVGHNVPYIPCQYHRANTALEHACNVNALIRELFNVLEQLDVFFTSSTKRFSHLKEKLEDIDIAIQLVNLSRTRWTARTKSVKALNQYLEKNIDKMKILTEILESPNFNVIVSINVIESTAKNIQNISNDTDAINNLIESPVIFFRTLHIDAENDYERHHRLIAMEMKAFYRKEFEEVIDSLAIGLTENSAALKEIFAPITKIFSFLLNKDNLSIENLIKASKLFPPGYKDHIPDVHMLKGQMEILIDICLAEGNEDFNLSKTPAKTLQDILYHVVKLKDILKQAHKLCISVITAAYGVASNERSFSQLKIVKSHLRTTMSDKRLNSLMLLKCEKELCKEVNPEHLVKRWV